MFSNSVIGVAFKAALAQLKEEELDAREAAAADADSGDADGGLGERVPTSVLDDMFAPFDSSPTSAALTERQERLLETIFADAMIEALALSRDHPAHSMVVRGTPAQQSSSSLADAGGASEAAQAVAAQFPLHRRIDNQWTIVLKDPVVTVSDAATQLSAVQARAVDGLAAPSRSVRLERQIECDFAVLRIQQLEAAKRDAPKRRTR